VCLAPLTLSLSVEMVRPVTGLIPPAAAAYCCEVVPARDAAHTMAPLLLAVMLGNARPRVPGGEYVLQEQQEH
jgi:hypothetical protein